MLTVHRLRRSARLWIERRHPLLAADVKRLRPIETLPDPPPRVQPTGEIAGGRTLIQEFTPDRDGLCGVGIRMATFGRVNDCTLVVRIYRMDDEHRPWRLLAWPRLISEQTVDAATLDNGGSLAAYFPPIADSSAGRFLFTLSADEATSANAVCAWLTPRQAPFGGLRIGTARLLHTSLVGDLRYAAPVDAPTDTERAIGCPDGATIECAPPPSGPEPLSTAELRDGRRVVQTFVAEDDWLSGMSVRLSPRGAADGQLAVSVIDLTDGPAPVSVQRTFDARWVASGEDLEVRFPPIARSAGRRYALVLENARAREGSGVEAWLAGRAAPHERLWLAGQVTDHLALMAHIRYAPPRGPRAYPDAILWSPVTWCNLSCRHCISRNTRQSGVHHLAQRIREDIRDLCRAGQIGWMGSDYSGDLIFNEAKYGTLTELLDFDVRFLLDTHGTGMTSAIADRLLDSRMEHLNFSIDAGRPDTYAWIRRGSRPLDDVLSNVALFTDARRAKGSRQPLEVSMSFTLMRRTIDEAVHFVELGARLGVDALAFRHLEVYSPEMAAESLYGERDHWNDVRGQIIARAATLGVQIAVPAPFDDRPDRLGHRHCPVPWQAVVILGNGDVMACCIPSMVIGNLYERSLDEIWNGSDYQTLRGRVNSETPPRACAACPPFRHANNRASYQFHEVLATLRPLREELRKYDA